MATKTSEINFLGLGNNPSDYDCKDGNLALAVNVLHENDSIHPAFEAAPEVKMEMPEGYEIVYLHKNADYTHYIVCKEIAEDNKRYYFLDENEDFRDPQVSGMPVAAPEYFDDLRGEPVNNVIAVGNTLIFYTSNDAFYYLWGYDKEGDKAKYRYLGDHLPEVEMSFSLTQHYYNDWYNGDSSSTASDEEFDIILDPEKNGVYITGSIPVHAREVFSTAVLAKANKFTGNWCNDKGYFSQPFLVRYALRLFDGSLVSHSAPILMTPTSCHNPIVGIYDSWNLRKFRLMCQGVGCSLNYQIGFEGKDKISQWKDIITGIDVYVSSQYYTYDQSGIIKNIGPIRYQGLITTKSDDIHKNSGFLQLNESYSIAGQKVENAWSMMRDLLVNAFPTYTNFPAKGDFHTVEYQNNKMYVNGVSVVDYQTNNEISNSIQDFKNPTGLGVIAVLPEHPSDVTERIKNDGVFYLLKSIDTDSIVYGNNYVGIDVLSGVLSSIETHQRMSDDFESHHRLIPNIVHSYNSRLNLANVNKVYFEGFKPSQMFADTRLSQDKVKVNSIVIYINDTQNNFHRVTNISNAYCSTLAFSYFFYPDVNAYKAEILCDNGYKYILPLKEHANLNGSVYFNGLCIEPEKKEYDISSPIEDDSKISVFKSLLYTTNVNNPFKIEAKNVEQVGTGKIIALAPTTLPLSQGQYGYAEMYCFTTDGIWALKVSDTGGWSAKQPFHYDVILNEDKDNILRMERDVLFSSNRGLMILAGNSVDCITNIFNGKHDKILDGTAWSQQFNQNWKKVLQTKILPKVWGATDEQFRSINMYEEFNKFIGNAVYLYDYTHQRIIVGNPNYTFSYVFGLEDKLWTSIPIKILSAVNSYPQCYANVYDEYNKQNLLVDFASDGNDKMDIPIEGLIITRPFKLNSPSVQKTLRTINLHGQFDKNHTSMILLGCNDNLMKDWFVVSSCEGSRLPFRYGTPFKAFRLMVVTKLTENESLSGFTVEYEYKELNKERQ